MSEAMAVALLGVFSSVICALIASRSAAKTMSTELAKKLEISQAVNCEKIESLTREVREHNNFARRMPVVEEQIKVINHRIDDLEKYHH